MSKVAKLTATSEEGAIVIRIETATEAGPDELVALADSGLETRAWQRLVREGALPGRRIGRRWYTTRRALLALVQAAPTGHASDFARLVAGERRRA